MDYYQQQEPIVKKEDLAELYTDLLKFTQVVFKAIRKTEFIYNWHHKVITNSLEQCVTGDITRLIITIPPRYSKTLILQHYIAWSLGIAPDSEFIYASYSKQLATQNSWAVRELIKSKPYRDIFSNVVLREDASAKDEWRTSQGGLVYASGSDGALTGFGAGKMRAEYGGSLVIDDPHKAHEIHSKACRQAVIDWFQNTIQSRINSPHTPIILISQRLHEEDLAGFLLGGGTGEKWTSIVIPALQEDGTPLWPAKHSLESLKRLKEKSPYEFESQYQQQPRAVGGNLIKFDWWKFYKIVPSALEYKVITGDTALKTSLKNDFSVFQCWGKAEGKIYLLDQIRGKWESPELKQRLVSFWAKHASGNIPLRAVYIEDKASGTGLMQDIRNDRKVSIPIVPVPRNIDKLTRVYDGLPYIESGYVYLPSSGTTTWLSDYLAEMSAFSPAMTHKHDDQIDPTLDAIDILLRPPKYQAGVYK